MEELIRILLKWLRPIAMVTAVAVVGSIIISFVLPERYTSTVTFMAANPYMMERGNLFQVEAGENPVYLFGGENDMNRFISLAESRGLEGYIIDKFNLYEHYDIDTTGPLKEYWVKEELRSNFKMLKTPEMTLQVEVTDQDKNLAAEMANTIVQRLDELNKALITEKKRDLTKLYDDEEKAKSAMVTQLMDSLRSTIELRPKDTITARLITSVVEDALSEYNTIRMINEQHRASLEQASSTVYIIEAASPAIKRSSPVRWLIVVSATAATLLAMCLMAVLIEKFQHFRTVLSTN